MFNELSITYEGEILLKITEPKVEYRDAQHYMGIRTQVTVKEMGEGVIPQLIGEVFAWLKEHDVAQAGPPLLRLHVINMEAKMDIEVGWPVVSALSGDDRVHPGILSAGRYASLIYTGVKNAMEGNKALLDWGAEKGLVWDRWDVEAGDAFASRFESFLTGPVDDPDPDKWDTEVAIKLADNQPQ